jgi:hypothetical protein
MIRRILEIRNTEILPTLATTETKRSTSLQAFCIRPRTPD